MRLVVAIFILSTRLTAAFIFSLLINNAFAASSAVADSVDLDLQALRILAEQGDKRAAFVLATHYVAGRGVPRDDSEAVRWFTRAADGGLAEAQYNLGIMYVTGRGVAVDRAQAVKWYARAAEQGLIEAQFNLGTAYGTGSGVEQDDKIAAMWLGRAAKRGLAQAQFNLAALYEHGRGVRLDAHTALEWYKKAAEQGYDKAKVRYVALSEKMRFASKLDTAKAQTKDSKLAAAPSVLKSTPKLHATPDREQTTGNNTLLASQPQTGNYEAWVRQAPAARYTMQLASYALRKNALRFARSLGDSLPVGVYPSFKDGKPRFAVVRGEYATYELATAAITDLPAKLRKIKPWIRNFGRIQKQLPK